MWLNKLNKNPLPTLLAWDDPALTFFAKHDLVESVGDSIESAWTTKTAATLIKKQQPDGSWRYRGKTYDPETGTNYTLIETYRNLRIMVEMYGLNRKHPVIENAAAYMFSCQTPEGDIRGIIGNQYMPYYHGAILELLIKAGFGDDSRAIKGLEWLLSIQQNDGGWLIPAQTVPAKQKTNAFWLSDPIPPDRAKPHAHMVTGMVLRAYAAHPEYRHRPEVIKAGKALKSRLFKPDKYNDRKASSYWIKLQFPFWWTSLLTALDTLYWLGFDKMDNDIFKGVDWFLTHQESDGLWPTGYGSGKRSQENRHWVGLATCRMLKCFYQSTTNVI